MASFDKIKLELDDLFHSGSSRDLVNVFAHSALRLREMVFSVDTRNSTLQDLVLNSLVTSDEAKSISIVSKFAVASVKDIEESEYNSDIAFDVDPYLIVATKITNGVYYNKNEAEQDLMYACEMISELSDVTERLTQVASSNRKTSNRIIDFFMNRNTGRKVGPSFG